MLDTTNDRFIRLPEVIERTGLSRSTIYQKMAGGLFPPQRKLGLRIVAWYQSEIDAWVAHPR